MTQADHPKKNRRERVWKHPRPILYNNEHLAEVARRDEQLRLTPTYIYSTSPLNWKNVQSQYLEFVWNPLNWRVSIEIANLSLDQQYPKAIPDYVEVAIGIRKNLVWASGLTEDPLNRILCFKAYREWLGPHDFRYLSNSQFPIISTQYKETVLKIHRSEQAEKRAKSAYIKLPMTLQGNRNVRIRSEKCGYCGVIVHDIDLHLLNCENLRSRCPWCLVLPGEFSTASAGCILCKQEAFINQISSR
jgi:hypothetical protein